MAVIRIDDVSLHFRSRGTLRRGPVVVFSNSLGTDLRIWDAVIDRLPRDLGVVTYDMRGHGLSGVTPGPSALARHVDDLRGLLDHLGLDRVVICGLSMGGLIAQAFAASDPDRVDGLMLCDTAPVIGTREGWDARIAAVTSGGLAAIAETVLARWFTEDYRANAAAFPLYRTMLLQQSAEGYAAACAAIRDADLTATTAALTLPVQVVVGEDDQSTPPALVRAMADAIDGAHFAIIPRAGHLPPIEQPEDFARLLLAFLAKLPARHADRHATGMATRRLVLGDSHVDRAEARKTALDSDFQAMITEAAWGHVWSRPDLTLRERSMVTIAMLAALGRHEELALHVRATANTGATPEDIREVMLHVAIYAGVPAANHAIHIVKETLAGMTAGPANGGGS